MWGVSVRKYSSTRMSPHSVSHNTATVKLTFSLLLFLPAATRSESTTSSLPDDKAKLILPGSSSRQVSACAFQWNSMRARRHGGGQCAGSLGIQERQKQVVAVDEMHLCAKSRERASVLTPNHAATDTPRIVGRRSNSRIVSESHTRFRTETSADEQARNRSR